MSEPVFIRETAEAADLSAPRRWVEDVVAELRASGATWMRVSIKPDRSRMILEAWTDRPDVEGPTRWSDPEI